MKSAKKKTAKTVFFVIELGLVIGFWPIDNVYQFRSLYFFLVQPCHVYFNLINDQLRPLVQVTKSLLRFLHQKNDDGIES